VKSSAHLFVSIIAYGFILQFFGMGFNNFMRTTGAPTLALLTMIGGIVVCTFFNYLFVAVLGYGVAGSALATVIGQSASAIAIFLYFTVVKSVPIGLHRRNMVPNIRLIANILALGSAPFFLQLAAVIINAVLNTQLVYYGNLDPYYTAEQALAAIGVVQRIAMFAFFPIMGVSVAVQPIIGFNYGAKQLGRVKDTFKIAFIWSVVLGVFFWLLIHLFPGAIVSIFNVHEDLYRFTITVVQVMMFFMPVIGLQVMVSGYFQATGQPLKSMFVSLTRQMLYLVPLLFITPLAVGFLLPQVTQLQSLFYAFPIADVLSVFTAGGMMFHEWRRHLTPEKKEQKVLSQV
jgi:Na+-driven multidrug efflux pump